VAIICEAFNGFRMSRIISVVSVKLVALGAGTPKQTALETQKQGGGIGGFFVT
jgi:hypothetical protein